MPDILFIWIIILNFKGTSLVKLLFAKGLGNLTYYNHEHRLSYPKANDIERESKTKSHIARVPIWAKKYRDYG